MSLKIRLARGGAKKRPFYRIVVADSRYPRDGRFIERIGSFNPLVAKDSDQRVVLDLEKAKEWLAKGATPTDRVHRFLDEAGVLKREARNNPTKAEPGKKAQERVEAAKSASEKAEADKKAAAEKAAADKAAAAEKAEADKAAAAEKPAEEPAAEAAAEPASDDAAA